jgi:hypothetical protein
MATQKYGFDKHVQVIDRNGEVALGHIVAYRQATDDYDLVYILRKPEVRVTTGQSASATQGNFGGAPIQINPEILVEGACHVSDPREGQPRFILAGEPESLLNQPETDAQRQSREATTADLNPPAGVTVGQAGPGAAPEPQGQQPVAEHPDIPPNTVEEPEPIPETKAQRKERRREGLE